MKNEVFYVIERLGSGRNLRVAGPFPTHDEAFDARNVRQQAENLRAPLGQRRSARAYATESAWKDET